MWILADGGKLRQSYPAYFLEAFEMKAETMAEAEAVLATVGIPEKV